MKVIRLRYRKDAGAIEGVCHLIRALGDQIEGESEEVLTVRMAPDGTIYDIRPPPGRELRGWIEAKYLRAEPDHPFVHRPEVFD